MVEETTSAARIVASATPPVAVSAFTFLGLPLQQWVYTVTILYTTAQLIRVLPNMCKSIASMYRSVAGFFRKES